MASGIMLKRVRLNKIGKPTTTMMTLMIASNQSEDNKFVDFKFTILNYKALALEESQST